MFDSFESFSVTTQYSPEVTIKGLKSIPATPLPPLLLLHGFPQTHHIWHRVAPRLLDRYTVILIDLRGYGASSKPTEISAYAKSAMARDCTSVMDALGFDSFFVAAHDRGARVAHKLCVDHPARVRAAIFLDICPTLAMYEATDFQFAKAYFHWFFLIQAAPLPETMILAEPRKVAEMFMGGRQGKGLSIFTEECWETYVQSMGDAETVHAMCQDYRAAATLDLEEAREDLKQGRLIGCPLTVVWGNNGVIEQCFDALKEWRAVTREGVAVEGYAVDSGHYLPEEAPNEVTAAIVDFLK
ncbi:alpha/beta hydrolase [Candidatus Bathyarchaeota archaeon]|nr:alpha/beta hydrolase [Candidatus Bathyarchaeota archaeon]